MDVRVIVSIRVENEATGDAVITDQVTVTSSDTVAKSLPWSQMLQEFWSALVKQLVQSP